jgi:predicted HAD superfamily Cof-like phosphohydrolase
MGQTLNLFSRDVVKFQRTLISEEFQELIEALYLASDDLRNKRAREEALKELADLVYVCYQLAAAVGWDLDEALDRVQASNMSKLVDGKPIRREDGKVLKGPNYQPPTLIDLV